ncbi:alpha/beta hydrolase [Bradyrhizobium prioriisuperbiae]|uniref:alpha/beta fold hydrolase n=1 Tax=Bradyrhizobium prioriisuperbiae TaxID=2854389 RepID=UPI0028E2E54F|nr:alpha/beta hydrolase [Bradyrhizobium prioritasuperba]
MKPYVEVVSGGTGPHLLLVHGFLSSRAQWRPNLEGLKAFCRPVIVELWGHGRSPTPDNPDMYRVASYLAAFDEIRRDLGVERWLVCGQSFGAGLTIRYAHQHSRHVIGQVFTNSLSALSAPGERESETNRLVRADAMERDGRPAIEALRFHPRFATRFAPEVKQEMLDDVARISPAAVANALRYTTPQLSVVDCLGEIRVPSLLINGVWERPFQPLRERALKLLPSLGVIDLEGGHSINAEAPLLFNEAIKSFVSSF